MWVERVAVEGVAAEGLGPDDQVVFERGGDADLGAELVGLTALAFVDALHLGRVPTVELGLSILGLPASRLLPDLPGLGQRGAQRIANSLSDRAEFACDLALQPAHDRAAA